MRVFSAVYDRSSGALPLSEIIRVMGPPLLTVALFMLALFGVLLPASEKNLLDQKKKMIAMLTQTGMSVLSHYEQQARSGKMTNSTAKSLALGQIRELRYGPEGKDYFWVNDLRPFMVMHPYRTDLEGHDVSDFSDPDGKYLFKEFVDVAAREGSGFVEYRWQWKDDPDRIAPKLSHVALFRPWGWVIGTGLYLEDVSEEISALTRKVATVSAGILTLMIALSYFIIRRGLRETGRRMSAEAEIRNYQDSLETLVAQRTAELQRAQSNLKLLSGLLPICASCKKIRDDRGYWRQLEAYIRDNSEATFSHGICPDCARELYPTVFGNKHT